MSAPRQRCERERGHVGLALQLGEGPLEHRRVDQILLARGDHQQERPGVESAADEGQQPEAHLVRPVEVFEDQRRVGLPCRHVLQEQAHALEEHQVVGDGRRVAVLRPRAPGRRRPSSRRTASGRSASHAPSGQRPRRSQHVEPGRRRAGSARSRGSDPTARGGRAAWTSAASSPTSRVLPTPASPTRATTRPCPRPASATTARSRAISGSRPMSGRVRGHGGVSAALGPPNGERAPEARRANASAGCRRRISW